MRLGGRAIGSGERAEGITIEFCILRVVSSCVAISTVPGHPVLGVGVN